jgi:hypothetical protein
VNDRVVIKGLEITGINQTVTPGTIGVRIIGAKSVVIEDTVITSFSQQGIADQRTAGNTNLFIRNSVIRYNTGTGVGLGATNTSKTHIENSSSINNLFGVAATSGNSVTIKRSVMAGNGDSGVEADGGGQISVDDSSITNNNTGVLANGTIRLSNTDILYNGTAVSGAAGNAQTYGNNRIAGNVATGTALTAAAPAQQ